MSSEVCRRDLCVKGDCRDRLWLDNMELQIIDTNGSDAFVSPRHERTFECICRQGFSGRFCDVPINHCSKELCMRTEVNKFLSYYFLNLNIFILDLYSL